MEADQAHNKSKKKRKEKEKVVPEAAKNEAQTQRGEETLPAALQAQLRSLRTLLSERAAADPSFVAPSDLASLSRRDRTKLLKECRKALGKEEDQTRKEANGKGRHDTGNKDQNGDKADNADRKPHKSNGHHDAGDSSRSRKPTASKPQPTLEQLLDAELLPQRLTQRLREMGEQGLNPLQEFQRKSSSDAATASSEHSSSSSSSLSPSAFSQVDRILIKGALKKVVQKLREAAADESALLRHRRKRKEQDDRYQLPRELNISRELQQQYPEANARREAKERKLYRYERNQPNYKERVAAVRQQFLEEVMKSINHVGGSGGSADGGSDDADADSTLQSTGRWDRSCKLVAEYIDVDGLGDFTHAPATDGVTFEMQRALEEARREAVNIQEEEEEEDKDDDDRMVKRTKLNNAQAAASFFLQPTPQLLQHSYRPRFISSFTWLPGPSSDGISPLDASAQVAYCAKRMLMPGAPYPYMRPQLPLVFQPTRDAEKVDKPEICALLMAAARAGVKLEGFKINADSSNTEQAVTQGEMNVDQTSIALKSEPSYVTMEDVDESVNQSKKDRKKEKKRKRREPEAAATAAAASSQSTAASASISSSLPTPAPVSPFSLPSRPTRFISYRNNFRKLFNRHDYWRVDLQRVGETIFMRRHLTYDHVNPFDAGHLFEQACKESSVLAAMAAAHGGGKLQQRRHEDSTTHPYRAIVQASFQEFELLTSIEIDLYKKPPNVKPDASAIAAAIDAVRPVASSSSSSTTTSKTAVSSSLPPAPLFPADPLSCFLELKTVRKIRWDRAKKSDVWIQTWLGGVPWAVVGYKTETSAVSLPKHTKEAKKARKVVAKAEKEMKEELRKTGSGSGSGGASNDLPPLAPIAIHQIDETETSRLLDSDSKEKLLHRFYAMLRFLAHHVEECKVYKLEHRKRRLDRAGSGAGTGREHGFKFPFPQPNLLPHSARWEMKLEEIEGGVESMPIIAPGLLKQIEQWAAAEDIKDKEKGKESKKHKSHKKEKAEKDGTQSETKPHSSDKKNHKRKAEGDAPTPALDSASTTHVKTEKESHKKKKDKKRKHDNITVKAEMRSDSE